MDSFLHHIFSGDGLMARLNRSHDWSQTDLGDPSGWPQSLKTALSILLNSQTPMVLWWGDQQYRFENDAFAAKLGMHLTHVAGRKGIDGWSNYWHPLVEFAEVAKRSGEGIIKENFKITLDHHGQPVQTNWALQFTPFPDETGQIAGVLAICQETTPPENYFAHLELSETRFQNLMRQSPVGMIVVTGPEMRVEVINEAYARLTGKTTDELYGKPLFDVLPETREHFYPILERVRLTGEPVNLYEHPYEVKTSDGPTKGFLNLIYQPYRGQDNEISGVMVVCQDVTGEIVSRKIARESENRIRALVTAAPFPFGIYEGKDMIITFANDAIREIYGKGPDIIGKSYYDILPEVRSQGISLELDKVFKTGEPYHARNARVDIEVDGEMKTSYFNYSFTPMFDAEGKVAGVINTGADVTDLYRMNKKLVENEKRFRSLIEEAPVGTCVLIGPDHRVEIANSLLLKRWGKGPEIIGTPLGEVLPELQEQRFLDILAEVYRSGEPYEERGALVKRRVNGEMTDTYSDFNFQPLRNAQDEVYGVLAMSTDVTETVLIHKKILESQKQLLASFEQAPAAIAILSGPEHTFIMANEFYGEMVDRPLSELIGKNLLDALPEIREQGFSTILDTVASTGTPFIADEISVELLRNNVMETRYVDLVYQPQFNDEKEVTSILVVATDVTKQVVSRKKLEVTEASLRAAIELAELATWTYDRTTKMVTMSPRLMEWQGSDEAEKPLSEALYPVPADQREPIAAYIDSVFDTPEGIYEREHPIINRKTGEIRIVSTRGQVTLNAAGKPDIITGTARDVTKERRHQRQLEAEIEKATEELRISNLELASANKLLKESNAELAQFAYVASHDLQEPVRKISFFSEMLQSRLTNLDEKSAANLDKIQTSAARMSNLIRDILGYSQLAKEGMVYKKTDLNKILKEIIGDFDLIIEEKKAIIEYDKLPTIEAIPLQMTQLFGNLVSNSLKYSRKNVPPHIFISSEELSDANLPPDEWVKITVRDNGIGFDEKYAQQIFNIFQRLHGKLDYQGTGIGLAMCKKIVQNHNGQISATGTEGKGAEFVIILPLTHAKK